MPNIIYILADDLGYGDIGAFNPDCRIPTPNIDRLAAEGMTFTDAHSSSAVCTPSRYSILTGRYCWRTSLKHGVLYGYEPPLIERDRPTVARVLKRAGYTTACIGKWHLGLGYHVKPGCHFDFARPLPWGNAAREDEEKIDFARGVFDGPTALGFDYFFGCSGCPTCQPPYGFIENERFVEIPSEYRPRPPFAGRPGMAAPSWQHKEADPTFARKAVEFIERQAGSPKPFFLYLCSSAPHEPCVEETVPEFARGKSRAGHRGDLVWLFDWMVGQVLDALERTGQANDTLVFVTSDNGALPGDRVRRGGDFHGYATYGHKSCGHWRGYKAHIWEGGHREPLIAWWPGQVPGGTTCDQLVGIFDLLPTVAELTGQKVPPGAAEDAISILPLLEGNPAARGREVIVHHSCFGVFSIRKGPWKMVYQCENSGGWPPPRGTGPKPGSPGQLYNLDEDPREQRNLWHDLPEKVRELEALLAEVRGGA